MRRAEALRSCIAGTVPSPITVCKACLSFCGKSDTLHAERCVHHLVPRRCRLPYELDDEHNQSDQRENEPNPTEPLGAADRPKRKVRDHNKQQSERGERQRAGELFDQRLDTPHTNRLVPVICGGVAIHDSLTVNRSAP